MPGVLHHFSEDPTIRRFVPHVPASNPTQAPAVWAIDTAHAPLYWFPRDCPRVTVWPRDESERPAFEERFGTTAPRLHAVEAAWLERMRTVDLYRYDLPATTFRRWEEASGQWISRVEVGAARRSNPSGTCWPCTSRPASSCGWSSRCGRIRELAVSDEWDFSIVRMRNAV